MMPSLLSIMIEWEFLALIYLLSVCRCCRFVLDPIAIEESLTFAWCTWLSSWCVEMVLHGMWRWFFSWCVEMVAF